MTVMPCRSISVASADGSKVVSLVAMITCAPTVSGRNNSRPAMSKEIVVAAKSEAERLAADAKVKVEEFVARRTQMAETKIAQAEAQALADVRAAAADAAVAAAERILTETTKGKVGEDLIAQGIRDLRSKLN